MLSFTKVFIHFFVSPKTCAELNTLHHSFVPFNLFEGNSRNKKRKVMSLHFVDVKEHGSLLGSLELKNKNYGDFLLSNCSGFVRRCKTDWESEGDFALEADILEFMKNSETPEAFPSKKQLVDGGRIDLVEAILKQGGWLAFGWDLDDDIASEKDGLFCTDDINLDFKRDKAFKNGAIQGAPTDGAAARNRRQEWQPVCSDRNWRKCRRTPAPLTHGPRCVVHGP